MMVGIYLSASGAFQRSSALAVYSPIGDPLLFAITVAITSVTTMLFLSSCVCACSALFMSRELELAFSSPVSSEQFLTGKAADIALSSGWMLTTFGLPVLVACGQAHNAGVAFYALSPLLIVSLFIPTVLLAMTAVLTVAMALPVQRGRELFLLLFVAALGIFLFSISPPWGSSETLSVASAIQRIESVSLLLHSLWFPPTLAAQALRRLLEGHADLSLVAIAAFSTCSAVVWWILKTAFDRVYHRAFAKAHAISKPYRVNSRSAQRLAAFLLPLARPATRAIATKEAKVFSRDITHTVQLGMLLAICFIYLYSFRNLKHPSGLDADASALWEIFLLLGNATLSSLVIISICSRFVFPSVSLEGASFWIILSAPLSHGELLRAKYKGWLVPILTISTVVFSSGAMALDAAGELVVASVIAGLIISYGIVGLAIGLGAVFAQFDADHSSQVSTSLGGFIFIFASMTLVVLDIVPLAFIFGRYLLFPSNAHDIYDNLIGLYVPLALLLTLNIAVTALAIRAGRRTLRTVR
jgi:ABC-2 type transport system permease protein